MHSRKESNLVVIAVLLLTTFFWGSSFAVAKYAMAELTPLALAAVRFVIGGLMYAVLLGFLPAEQCHISKQDWLRLVFLALLGVTTYFWVQYTGVSLTTATNASLIIATSPLFVAVLSTVINREELSIRAGVGIVIAYSGVILVISRGSLDSFWQPQYMLGNLLMVLNACCWALFTVLGRRITAKYPPFTITAYISIIGAIGLIPLGLSEGLLHQLKVLSLPGWLAVVYLATFCTVVGYGGWYFALSRIEASHAAVFQYLQPLYTMLLSVWLLGESVTWHVLLGAILIITGLRLSAAKRPAPSKSNTTAA